MTESIDWNSGVPAHIQIAGFIRRAIEAGEVTKGDRLADRNKMSEQFDVATATISKAIAVLREEGLVLYRPGRGLFVARDLRSPGLGL